MMKELAAMNLNSAWHEFLNTDVRVLFDVALVAGLFGFVLGYFVR